MLLSSSVFFEFFILKSLVKLKIAGTFRNLNNAKYYCNAISIIDTCIKQKENIFDCLKNIFEGKKKIFAF